MGHSHGRVLEVLYSWTGSCITLTSIMPIQISNGYMHLSHVMASQTFTELLQRSSGAGKRIDLEMRQEEPGNRQFLQLSNAAPEPLSP